MEAVPSLIFYMPTWKGYGKQRPQDYNTQQTSLAFHVLTLIVNKGNGQSEGNLNSCFMTRWYAHTWLFAVCIMCSHLVIDGGPKHNKKEAECHHRQDTKEGGQEDGQPHVGLVQRVSSCT